MADSAEGLGFASPINEAAAIMKDLLDYGYVKGRPLIGVNVREITKELAYYNNLLMDHGLYIMSVTEGSAAEKAGLNPYMVEIANIREHCSWIHKDMEEATEKAEEDTKKMIDVSDTNSRIDNINFIKSILSYYSSQPQNKYDKPDDFIRYIDVLLNTKMPSNCVRVCSVHKAKGLEAPQTFVLNEAKVCTDRRNSWEQNEQEKNRFHSFHNIRQRHFRKGNNRCQKQCYNGITNKSVKKEKRNKVDEHSHYLHSWV